MLGILGRIDLFGLGDQCGHDRVDLRAAMRGPDSDAALDAALTRAIRAKPERHDFHIDAPGAAPALARHMSMTGG